MNTFENQYVIVRGDRAGVFFGILKEENGDQVLLEKSRKIHYWSGAAAVEEIAVHGINNLSISRITVEVSSIRINQVIQILPCSEKSIENIKSAKEWRA